MKPSLAKELILDVLLMALWRHKDKHRVIAHSNQGSQYCSDDWKSFLSGNQLEPSISSQENCWDNAVAESFFQQPGEGVHPQVVLQNPGYGPGRCVRLH